MSKSSTASGRVAGTEVEGTHQEHLELKSAMVDLNLVVLDG